MRFVLLVVVLVGAAGVSAAGIDTAWRVSGQRSLEFSEDVARAQLVDDTGPRTTEQMFGAGVALGLYSRAVGLGVSGWFDFYFTPWISAGLHTGLAYGFLTRPYEEGGTGLAYHLSLGAKFTFDFPDWDWARWVRPWVGLYPLGFQLFTGVEDINPPGPDDHDVITYSDLTYYIMWGGGVDFYLTSNIGLGTALYFNHSIGGGRHEHRDVVVRTRGRFGVYWEYIRLSLRF